MVPFGYVLWIVSNDAVYEHHGVSDWFLLVSGDGPYQGGCLTAGLNDMQFSSCLLGSCSAVVEVFGGFRIACGASVDQYVDGVAL